MTATRATADIIRIGDLQRENDLLQIRVKAAEDSLALYKIALFEANAIRCQLMNELAEMRFGPRPPAVVIPIREAAQ